MLPIKRWVNKKLTKDSSLISLIGNVTHISDSWPESTAMIFPLVIYQDDNQSDWEYADNKPTGSNIRICIHVFTKISGDLSTTTDIGTAVWNIFNAEFWDCGQNGEVPDDNPSVRHRIMRFSRQVKASELVYVPDSTKAITAFSIVDPAVTGTINGTTYTIALVMPLGTNPSALTADFTTTGDSVNILGTDQIPGMTVNDFTHSVVYIVVAEDGTTQNYTVNTQYLYVTYNGNGNDSGSFPIDYTVYKNGDSATVLGKGTLALTDFTFSKWNTAVDGSGTDYNLSDIISMTSNLVLYAQWI